jgi:hypothetical protein
MARVRKPTSSDLTDALLNIYEKAYNCDGSVANLRELQNSCVSEVESVIPDAEEQIADGDPDGDE